MQKIYKERLKKKQAFAFGIVEKHQFAAIPVIDEQGQTSALGVEQSEFLWNYLRESGYVDHKGQVQDSLRTVLKEHTLQNSEVFQPHLAQITDILKKIAGKLDIKNANERVQIKRGTQFFIVRSSRLSGNESSIKQRTVCNLIMIN